MSVTVVAPGGPPLRVSAIESVLISLCRFRIKVLNSSDSRASNILSALDTLINELYSNAAKTAAPANSSFTYTPNATNEYTFDHFHKRD